MGRKLNTAYLATIIPTLAVLLLATTPVAGAVFLLSGSTVDLGFLHDNLQAGLVSLNKGSSLSAFDSFTSTYFLGLGFTDVLAVLGTTLNLAWLAWLVKNW